MNHRVHRGASRYIEKPNDHIEIVRRCAEEKYYFETLFLFLCALYDLCGSIKIFARNKFHAYGVAYHLSDQYACSH